jgi:hypothetical protein
VLPRALRSPVTLARSAKKTAIGEHTLVNFVERFCDRDRLIGRS